MGTAPSLAPAVAPPVPPAADTNVVPMRPVSGKVAVPTEVAQVANAEAAATKSANAAEGVDAVVARLNDDHFVALEGGTAFVFREGWDPELGQRKLERMTSTSFRTLYSHEYVQVVSQGVSKPLSVGAVWLNAPARRTYPNGLAMIPNGEVPPGTYNIWRGMGATPNLAATLDDVVIIWRYLVNVICAGDTGAAGYLLRWMAHGVQRPEKAAEVAIVLTGGRGTGKGTLGRWWRDLFGEHGLHIMHSRHLVGNFNAHLRLAVAAFVDESFFVGDKAGNNVLKGLITEDQIAIEQKGVDVFMAKNRLKIIMATNDDHAVLAGVDERRYLVLKVSDKHKQDHAYFGALNAWWGGGGKEALLGYLLTLPLADFNIRQVPNTGALEDQKLASLDPLGQWVLERLKEGKLAQHDREWKPDQPRKMWAEEFGRYARDRGHRYVKDDTTSVGRRLAEYFVMGERRDSANVRYWHFPGLDAARQQFSEALGLHAVQWERG